MKSRKPIIRSVVLLFLLPWLTLSQTPDKLLTIINAKGLVEDKQSQIDSFLQKSKDTMSLSQLADCYHDLGSKWHFKNWEQSKKAVNLENAIFVTQKAIDLKRRSENLGECSLNRSLYNLGYFLSLDNHLQESINVFVELIEKGHQYCPKNSKKENYIFWAMQELGRLYEITGDFYKAIDTYRTLILTIGGKDAIWTNDHYFFIIFAHRQLANLYFLMNASENQVLIRGHLKQAVDYLKKSGLPCCDLEVHINQEYGNFLLDIKKYSEALGYHRKALKLLPLEDSLNLAIVQNSMGISYLNLGNDVLALESLHKAIAYNVQYPDPYNNLGDFYSKKGNFKETIKNYQKAIDLALGYNVRFSEDSIPTIEELEFVPDKTPLLNHIVTKANGWIKYYEHDGNYEHLDRALETFDLADQLVDLIRFGSTEHQSKLFWREQGAQLYMKAVEVCYLLNKPEEAFHFMERNKALLLLEDLTNQEAKEMANLPQKLAEREFYLKREIFLSENDLQETGNEELEVIAELRDSVNASKYRYEEFIDSLNQAYPDYAKFKKKADILTFNELQSNYISDDLVVLHYILNEEDGYGLLTSADGPILFQLENTAQLNNDIDSLTSLLSSGISDISTFNKTSHTLFKNLIPGEIYKKIKGKQLIIVPDYNLQRIPFETLVVNTTKTKYLIEDAEISYVYSMSLLNHNKGNARHHATQLLGVAPIHFEKLGLVELTNSENEISGIAPFFDGELFLEDHATKANFLKEVAAPKIIHLATHADMGDGENPWIAFSDEKMYLKEIYATKNQSEMVVLSACNTLSGDLKRGEGVMSLARGFFYSGAKSVVSSLWPLTDEAGSDIMISFYQNLDKGQSKSKALRQAKLDYMNSNIVEELKHPFYWAGFVVVGDNAPLVSAWNPIVIYVGIVLVLALLYLFRRKFLKRLQ